MKETSNGAFPESSVALNSEIAGGVEHAEIINAAIPSNNSGNL
jgi:hypothetical protein